MSADAADSRIRASRRRCARCSVQTELGDFEIEFATDRAPVTSAYFIGLVHGGGLDGTSIYRIATRKNQGDRASCPIEVIQGGRSPCDIEVRPTIVHEPTVRTGLRHERWAVSAARYEAGAPYGSFFVCMRDEPELDFGGRRHRDGLGFAAFGRVSDGFAALESIVERAEGTEYLSRRIPIVRARMVR